MVANYETLADSTRVWIYQSSRKFTAQESAQIKGALKQFTEQWVSHNLALKAFGDIFHGQFIVLMVDETMAGASGCSIDKSVNFIRGVESEFGVNMFDRMTFAYQDEQGIHFAPRDEFAQLYQAGKINDATLVFDNLVKSKKDFDEAWLKPLAQSWHKRMV